MKDFHKYFEIHKMHNDYRDINLKDEYQEPVLYTIDVCRTGPSGAIEKYIGEMQITCDEPEWAVVKGRLYKKEGRWIIASTAIKEIVRPVEMGNREMSLVYKIREVERFKNYRELYAAIEERV